MTFRYVEPQRLAERALDVQQRVSRQAGLATGELRAELGEIATELTETLRDARILEARFHADPRSFDYAPTAELERRLEALARRARYLAERR